MFYIHYRSQFDGAPCVCILTGKSANKKTGNMVQVWFLRRDVAPLTALQCGTDRAVCGTCPLRKKGCYVNVSRAPQSVWQAYRRGSYRSVWGNRERARRKLRGRALRLGAYGDPASAPIGLVRFLLKLIEPACTTGYTHAWETAPELQPYCMASVESTAMAERAQMQGWRTFRIRAPGGPLLANEVVCCSESSGLKCIQCGLCNGVQKYRKSVVITVHGAQQKKVQIA